MAQFGKKYICYYDELYTIGLSKVIRDWIMEPLRKAVGLDHQGQLKQFDEFWRLLNERAYAKREEFTESGTVKSFYQARKLHVRGRG